MLPKTSSAVRSSASFTFTPVRSIPTPRRSRFRSRSSRWPSDRNNRGLQDSEAPEAPETKRLRRPAGDSGGQGRDSGGQARESFVFERPIQTVGRRKEAVVRVRLVPGTGKFDSTAQPGGVLPQQGAPAAHQELRWSPVDRVESFDIFALLHGGGPSGQAGALRLGIARALILAPGGPARAEEGRLPHP